MTALRFLPVVTMWLALALNPGLPRSAPGPDQWSALCTDDGSLALPAAPSDAPHPDGHDCPLCVLPLLALAPSRAALGAAPAHPSQQHHATLVPGPHCAIWYPAPRARAPPPMS